MIDRLRRRGARPLPGACRRHAALAVAALDVRNRPVADRHVVAIVRPPAIAPAAAWRAAVARLFAYDVFPETVMRARVCTPDGLVRPGATIVQIVPLGLVAIEASVRIEDVWERTEGGDLARVAGFRYATLRGHPERGVETFELRQAADGSIALHVDALSSPGPLVVRLGGPVARRVQLRATAAALAHCAAWLAPA